MGVDVLQQIKIALKALVERYDSLDEQLETFLTQSKVVCDSIVHVFNNHDKSLNRLPLALQEQAFGSVLIDIYILLAVGPNLVSEEFQLDYFKARIASMQRNLTPMGLTAGKIRELYINSCKLGVTERAKVMMTCLLSVLEVFLHPECDSQMLGKFISVVLVGLYTLERMDGIDELIVATSASLQSRLLKEASGNLLARTYIFLVSGHFFGSLGLPAKVSPPWISSLAAVSLSRLIMEENGVESVISALFNSIDLSSGAAVENAQSHLAHILSSPPLEIPSVRAYFRAIRSQLLQLLRYAGEGGAVLNDTGARIISYMALQAGPGLAESVHACHARGRPLDSDDSALAIAEELIYPLVRPLLLFSDPLSPVVTLTSDNSSSSTKELLVEAVVASAEALEGCIEDTLRVLTVSRCVPLAFLLLQNLPCLVALLASVSPGGSGSSSTLQGIQNSSSKGSGGRLDAVGSMASRVGLRQALQELAGRTLAQSPPAAALAASLGLLQLPPAADSWGTSISESVVDGEDLGEEEDPRYARVQVLSQHEELELVPTSYGPVFAWANRRSLDPLSFPSFIKFSSENNPSVRFSVIEGDFTATRVVKSHATTNSNTTSTTTRTASSSHRTFLQEDLSDEEDDDGIVDLRHLRSRPVPGVDPSASPGALLRALTASSPSPSSGSSLLTQKSNQVLGVGDVGFGEAGTSAADAMLRSDLSLEQEMSQNKHVPNSVLDSDPSLKARQHVTGLVPAEGPEFESFNGSNPLEVRLAEIRQGWAVELRRSALVANLLVDILVSMGSDDKSSRAVGGELFSTLLLRHARMRTIFLRPSASPLSSQHLLFDSELESEAARHENTRTLQMLLCLAERLGPSLIGRDARCVRALASVLVLALGSADVAVPSPSSCGCGSAASSLFFSLVKGSSLRVLSAPSSPDAPSQEDDVINLTGKTGVPVSSGRFALLSGEELQELAELLDTALSLLTVALFDLKAAISAQSEPFGTERSRPSGGGSSKNDKVAEDSDLALERKKSLKDLRLRISLLHALLPLLAALAGATGLPGACAEMASTLQMEILLLNVGSLPSDEQLKDIQTPKQSTHETPLTLGPGAEPLDSLQKFEEALRRALVLIRDKMDAVHAHGLRALAAALLLVDPRLMNPSSSEKSTKKTDAEAVQSLLAPLPALLLSSLSSVEPYVYLAAVEAVSALCMRHVPSLKTFLRVLAGSSSSGDGLTNVTLRTRVKLCEAITAAVAEAVSGSLLHSPQILSVTGDVFMKVGLGGWDVQNALTLVVVMGSLPVLGAGRSASLGLGTEELKEELDGIETAGKKSLRNLLSISQSLRKELLEEPLALLEERLSASVLDNESDLSIPSNAAMVIQDWTDLRSAALAGAAEVASAAATLGSDGLQGGPAAVVGACRDLLSIENRLPTFNYEGGSISLEVVWDGLREEARRAGKQEAGVATLREAMQGVRARYAVVRRAAAFALRRIAEGGRGYDVNAARLARANAGAAGRDGGVGAGNLSPAVLAVIQRTVDAFAPLESDLQTKTHLTDAAAFANDAMRHALQKGRAGTSRVSSAEAAHLVESGSSRGLTTIGDKIANAQVRSVGKRDVIAEAEAEISAFAGERISFMKTTRRTIG